jgi:ligand-binding SRPBCC domain-containing protein
MITIKTKTQVDAPMDRCFKLALSIDLQKQATGLKAVDGVTSGLIGPGDTVTWGSRPFGWSFRHQSLIEVWRPYSYFREVMTAGAFMAYEHEHHFAVMNDGTHIRDEVRLTVSRTFLGSLEEQFIVRRRILRLIRQRNACIKYVAESDLWHDYLDGQPELDTRVYQARSAVPAARNRVYAD